ncbi:MAG: hypothetical protein J0L89_01880 [Xanthomonadales bacterium]|nr:hypothetical protein [Xanthomonadaceae bacterium]MBN8223549.1 hypothetical protein [Xanthomonadales bacterium]MCA0198853.1 hypothetical protein [Pseudomonadota bacterium]HRF83378.1 hypothetical protein [Pseudoxanthomonas sp.]
MRAFATAGLFALAIAPTAALAASDCSGPLVQSPLPLPATAVAPVAAELGSRASQLGMPSGVLVQAPDVSQSLDHVLLRLRISNCRDVAKALPPAATTVAASANDPAAYKPKTEFDNKPYRFDMTQNGKRMTADDFDAWLKANGYSAGRRVDTPQAAPAAPASTPPTPAPSKK